MSFIYKLLAEKIKERKPFESRRSDLTSEMRFIRFNKKESQEILCELKRKKYITFNPR